MWQHFISRETESSNVPVEIVDHFRHLYDFLQNHKIFNPGEPYEDSLQIQFECRNS
jgi:hypothetical protein